MSFLPTDTLVQGPGPNMTSSLVYKGRGHSRPHFSAVTIHTGGEMFTDEPSGPSERSSQNSAFNQHLAQRFWITGQGPVIATDLGGKPYTFPKGPG